LGNFMLSDTAACARSWEQTSRENPAYPTYHDEDCYVVAGTRGYLSIPTFRLKYHPEGIEPSWLEPFVEETLDVRRQDPLACQLEHFVQVIRGETTPLVSASDGLRNLKITEAIARSAVERKIIET
jgi:predicted dehydrogenase